MKFQLRHIAIPAALLLMFITRSHHFASTYFLPDATLAIFLLAGFMLPGLGRVSLAAFTLLMLTVSGIDYYAVTADGIEDYCITPAYLFLVPTYGMMWIAGSWLSRHMQSSMRGFLLFTLTALFATTAAFVISNAGFFLLSGRIGEMGLFEYVNRVAQYYLPYLGGSMAYLLPAALAYIAYTQKNQPAQGTALH